MCCVREPAVAIIAEVKCKVDDPLDAVDAEDARPGGKTVVPERARRLKRMAGVALIASAVLPHGRIEERQPSTSLKGTLELLTHVARRHRYDGAHAMGMGNSADVPGQSAV